MAWRQHAAIQSRGQHFPVDKTIGTPPERRLALYLHWNGGRDSVEAFLAYCDLRGFRPPDADECGWARLCQVIANFMGADGLNVGISRYTTGVPYVAMYTEYGPAEDNVNNYLRTPTVRRVRREG